jgi:hypothetical protein
MLCRARKSSSTARLGHKQQAEAVKFKQCIILSGTMMQLQLNKLQMNCKTALQVFLLR